MADSRFVYVTYIRTTPEKLWQALIDPEFTRRYWCETWQECEWKPGAIVAAHDPGRPGRPTAARSSKSSRDRARPHVANESSSPTCARKGIRA